MWLRVANREKYVRWRGLRPLPDSQQGRLADDRKALICVGQRANENAKCLHTSRFRLPNLTWNCCYSTTKPICGFEKWVMGKAKPAPTVRVLRPYAPLFAVVLELEEPMRVGKCKPEVATWVAVRFCGTVKAVCAAGAAGDAITLAAAARKLVFVGTPLTAEGLKCDVRPACNSFSRLGLPRTEADVGRCSPPLPSCADRGPETTVSRHPFPGTRW